MAITGSLLTTVALGATPTATADVAAPASARAETPPVGLVEDVHPGPGSASVRDIVALHGKALSVMDDGTHGSELWISDGSEAGTRMVVDLNTTERHGRQNGSYPSNLTRVGDDVFFTADDGVHGRELWKTDGTSAGTVRLTDLAESPSGYDYHYAFDLTPVGSTLYFTLDDGVHGAELWTSDGTSAGTAMVADINTGTRRGRALGSSPNNITAIGGTVYFSADDGVHGQELWKSDGTAAGTELVDDIQPGTVDVGYGAQQPAGSRPRYLTAVGQTLYFSADDGVHGQELWKSDGTAAGTELVDDIQPGTDDDYYGQPRPASSRPTGITAMGGALYFAADDGAHGQELWTSDGTADGTHLVKEINPTDRGYSYFGGYYGLVVHDGSLFFAADDGVHGTELWTSDGTAEGTRIVKDIATGEQRNRPRSSRPRDLTVLGDTVYFVAQDTDGDRDIWTTDGTGAGTHRFASVNDGEGDGYYSYGPSRLTAVGSNLYFAADDGVYGQELWSTAGAARSVPRVANETRPQISGEVVAGGVLTATPGTWSPSTDLSYAYQWYVGHRVVKAATRSRFRPGTSDVGKRISVRVITMHDGYRGAVAYSHETAPIADEPLVNLARPAARGEATVGKTLTATRGRWSVKHLTFRFTWSIGGQRVRGADERTFRLPSRAAGKKVTVKVTAVRPAGAKSARSEPRTVGRR